MNRYRVLYYPSFQPPEPWLRSILLLADEVTRIVPADVDPQDPPGILAIASAVPDCLTTVAPTTVDVTPQGTNLSRLDKAFELIGRGKPRNRKTLVTISISPGGATSVVGHVFLHETKVSREIKRLLRHHHLLDDDVTEMSQSLSASGYLVVDKKASNLILSTVADKVARRIGLDAITDEPFFFDVNVVNGFGLHPDAFPGVAEGGLLGSMATVLVPREISALSVTRYQELRNSYSELREAFKRVITELSAIHRLGRIQSMGDVSTRVQVIAQDFLTEFQRYKRTRYARAFRAWAPLCVGGVLSAVSSLVSPPVAVAIAGSSLAIQIVERHLDASAISPPTDRVFQLLSGLERDILRRSRLRAVT